MRLPRLDAPGCRHHVMNRGARHEPLFLDDDQRELFLRLLADLPARFSVRVHGYALMPNHYHLMLESVTGELPRAMRHLGGEYGRLLNVQHGWDGPVFRGRYRNRLVNTDDYWRHLLVYLHQNPVKAGLSSPHEAAWTSHRAYLGQAPTPPWLTTQELLALFGGPAGYAAKYRAVQDGGEHPPTSFDPNRLWVPDTTGSVAVPNFRDPTWELADALREVTQVVGIEVDELIRSRPGRVGNPAKWLAAWWLSRGCGIPHGKIKAALGVSHSTLSMRIARVEARRQSDDQLRKWLFALREARSPGLVREESEAAETEKW